MGKELSIPDLKIKGDQQFLHDELQARVFTRGDPSNFLHDVANITVWRNCYPHAYRTIFFSTFQRTLAWANNVYMTDDDDLMLIPYNESGVSYGHISFSRFSYSDSRRFCDLSRVMKAPGLAGSKEFKSFVQRAVYWCLHYFELSHMRLEVFSDNASAVRLYQDIGFKSIDETGLKLIKVADELRWMDTEGAREGKTMLQMELER